MNEVVRAADKPLRQVSNVRELLVNKQAQDQLGKVAAKHLNPERMMRVLANAVRVTPKLAECEPMTLLGALMQCATLGLEPNTPMGHAFLIPFGSTVTLVVGYKGLADMARRSGQVRGIHSDVVYSDDELWDYEYGSEARLRHKPGPRNGTKLGAYCHAKLSDEGQAFVFLPWAEVMRVRDGSQGYKNAKQRGRTDNPWMTHEDAMARKTALRALANRGELPISVEFAQAVEVDDSRVDYSSMAMDPGTGPIIEGTAEPEQEETPHDPETGEVTEQAPAPKPRAPRAAPPAPQPVETKPRPSRHDKPEPVEEAQEQDAEPGITPERRAELERLQRTILDNAEIDAADARSVHARDLQAMREEAYDLWTATQEELAAFEAAQAQGGKE